MWRALTEERGIGGRDQIWEHPDLLPTAEDLDDPEGFVRGRPELDLSGLTVIADLALPQLKYPAFVPSESALPQDIDIFTTLARQDETGAINHNLRTIVVNASGRIQKIFTGNNWKADELAAALEEAAKVD